MGEDGDEGGVGELPLQVGNVLWVPLGGCNGLWSFFGESSVGCWHAPILALFSAILNRATVIMKNLAALTGRVISASTPGTSASGA